MAPALSYPLSRALTFSLAKPDGGISAPGGASRSVINPSISSSELYLNIAKGLGISSVTPGYFLTFDADQYPQGNTTPYANGDGNMPWRANYYG